jgi:SpoVK/Ycf46/Vps4 family AAA+-type ATPase
MEPKVEQPVMPVFGQKDGETWKQFETRSDEYVEKQIDYRLAKHLRSSDSEPQIDKPKKPGELDGETWKQFVTRRDEYLQRQIDYRLVEHRRCPDMDKKVEKPQKPKWGELDGETLDQFETRQEEYLQSMVDYKLASHLIMKVVADVSEESGFDEGEYLRPLVERGDHGMLLRREHAVEETINRLEQIGFDAKRTRAAIGRVQGALEPTPTGGLLKVAGMTDLKALLIRDVIGPLKDPDLYRRYRVSLPNGILFYGPPGCGKTYIARSLAEELGWHFQYCRPSDVASPYIHDTVSKIRAIFAAAIAEAPSIVFIDEFEAFVPARSELGGHQQYKAEEVNEFLANLEGCAERKVLVIAATNEPDKIDPAVRRSGRFDKLILIPPPDAEARRAMLEFHLRDRPVEPSIDTAGIAAVLEGYAASDLRLLVDEAARMALKQPEPISTATLLAALKRVPPSITEGDVARYSAFRSRGTYLSGSN